LIVLGRALWEGARGSYALIGFDDGLSRSSDGSLEHLAEFGRFCWFVRFPPGDVPVGSDEHRAACSDAVELVPSAVEDLVYL
jgi:hypothetical protein